MFRISVFSLLIIVGLIYSTSAFAQVELKEGNQYSFNNSSGEFQESVGSIISFQSIEHDFGNVPEGPELSHTFTFKNIGNEPLIITDALVSCGCTKPSYPNRPIMPGEVAFISVAYETMSRLGNFHKTIRIKGNFSEGERSLFIKGLVQHNKDLETLTISPQLFKF